MSEKLTNKQRAFVAEYMKDMNGTQAAIRAGYSRKTAASIASENLTKPKIRRAVEQAMKNAAMTPEEVAYRLSQQARSSMADFVRPQGNVLFFDFNKAMDAGAFQNVAKVTLDSKTGFVTEIALHDAQKALIQLGKIYAMFVDKHEHKHSFEQELEAAGYSASDEFNALVASMERVITNS